MPKDSVPPVALLLRHSELVIEELTDPREREQAARSQRGDDRRPSGRWSPGETHQSSTVMEVKRRLEVPQDFLRVRREHHEGQERGNPKILDYQARPATQRERHTPVVERCPH